MTDTPQASQEFRYKIIETWHNDSRSLIAAGKAQRWDVVKWTITVNLALAAASASFHKSPGLFLVFTVGMATIGALLALHINYRMTQARRRLRKLNEYISKNVFDVRAAIIEEPSRDRGALHDRQELWLFAAALALSITPSLTVWLMG